MSFLKRVFSKKKEEDFETVLSSLASDIQKRQVKLSEIRLREKRSTLLATVYTLSMWLVYTSLWYLDALPPLFHSAQENQATTVEGMARGIPVLIGPIIILFIRRITQVWYTRKANAEEKTLQSLMKQRRAKVEEIKKKTNFDSIVKLFQEYDEQPPPPGATSTTIRNRLTPNRQQQPITPQRQVGIVAADSRLHSPPVPVTLQAQLTPVPSPFPMTPPQKRWYDKVADALLGDDEHEIGSPSSRYALICERCFTHNGLVKESMWEDAQFVCRNQSCNHFNRSARSKREHFSTTNSPQSITPSPTTTRSNEPPAVVTSPHPRCSPAPNEPSAVATPTPHPRSSPTPNESANDSDPDAPTVDSVDAGSMEVDS